MASNDIARKLHELADTVQIIIEQGHEFGSELNRQQIIWFAERVSKSSTLRDALANAHTNHIKILISIRHKTFEPSGLTIGYKEGGDVFAVSLIKQRIAHKYRYGV